MTLPDEVGSLGDLTADIAGAGPHCQTSRSHLVNVGSDQMLIGAPATVERFSLCELRQTREDSNP